MSSLSTTPVGQRERRWSGSWVGRVLRPPLSKKSFPVSRVSKKTASREVGNFFFLFISFFYELECKGGKVKKIYIFLKIGKKKF